MLLYEDGIQLPERKSSSSNIQWRSTRSLGDQPRGRTVSRCSTRKKTFANNKDSSRKKLFTHTLCGHKATRYIPWANTFKSEICLKPHKSFVKVISPVQHTSSPQSDRLPHQTTLLRRSPLCSYLRAPLRCTHLASPVKVEQKHVLPHRGRDDDCVQFTCQRPLHSSTEAYANESFKFAPFFSHSEVSWRKNPGGC